MHYYSALCLADLLFVEMEALISVSLVCCIARILRAHFKWLLYGVVILSNFLKLLLEPWPRESKDIYRVYTGHWDIEMGKIESLY